MYAVIYKERVIVGPMYWNRAIFVGSLDRHGVKATLPRIAPETLPLVINEDAKIVYADEQRPNINRMVEYHYGPIWDLSEDKAIANYEVQDLPLEFAKNNFKSQAAEERWKKEVAGTKINIQDIELTLDTSREGRNIFIQKYSIMSDGDVVNWKFPEGWLTITKDELGMIIATGAQYIQSCFDWEKDINDLIDAAASKEDLIVIEIVEESEQSGRPNRRLEQDNDD